MSSGRLLLLLPLKQEVDYLCLQAVPNRAQVALQNSVQSSPCHKRHRVQPR